MKYKKKKKKLYEKGIYIIVVSIRLITNKEWDAEYVAQAKIKFWISPLDVTFLFKTFQKINGERIK